METNQQKTWTQLATECALKIERGEQVAVAPVLVVEDREIMSPGIARRRKTDDEGRQ